MIGKGSTISSTRSAIAYGWNQDKEAEVVFRQNLIGEDPLEIAQEFRFIQSQNANCSKNTLSFIISPTIEDGKKLSAKDLGRICRLFMAQMNLGDRQGIGFVHRDKKHIHIHLYVNRIDFRGDAYHNGFLSNRSQFAAIEVAKQMNLTTIGEVINEKLNKLTPIRKEIRRRHDITIKQDRPKTFNQYIKAMETNGVKVIPCINKSGRLQGFRFTYKGHNLKGSVIDPSMSAGNLAMQLYSKSMNKSKQLLTVKISNKSVPLAQKLALSISKRMAKKAIKQTINTGIEI